MAQKNDMCLQVNHCMVMAYNVGYSKFANEKNWKRYSVDGNSCNGGSGGDV